MKKYIHLICVYMMCTYCSYSQDTIITSIEYYVDTDPGPGNGTTIFSGTPSDTVLLNNVNINMTGLNPGLHVLCLRAKSQNGTWSVISGKSFYINQVEPNFTSTALEYYIDTDPGPGNGIEIPTPPGDSIIINNFNIPLTGYNPGHHLLVIRSQASNNVWSVISAKSFFVKPAEPNFGITNLEYYIDTDPGPGNGLSIPVTSGDSINVNNFTIPLTGYNPGHHLLVVRAKAANNVWSVISAKSIFIKPAEPNFGFTNLEYFVDSDPGVGLCTSVAVTPGDTLLLNDIALSISGYAIGPHQLYVRAKTSDNTWSVISGTPFKICTNYGAKSKMDFQIEGNKVFFTNQSLYTDTTRWEFGDGSVDTVLNPIKTYINAGNYTLRLISKNECAIDTLTSIISIKGLQRINARKSGNTGIATVFFEGNGFTPSTELKLKKGATEIFPVEKQFYSANRYLAYFNLNNAPTGSYDVIGVLGGSGLDTIKNGFTIEPARPTYATLEDIGGRNPARFNQMYRRFAVQNQGNEDAIMVPVIFTLGYNSDFTNVSFGSNENFVDLSNEGIFQNTFQYLSTNNISSNVLNPIDIDATGKRQILAFYKIKVPSESYTTTDFRIFNPAFYPFYNMGYMTQPPMFGSGIVLNNQDSVDIRDCLSAFLKKAVKKNLTVNINDDQWNSCFNTAYDTLRGTVKNLVRNFNLNNKSIPLKAVYSTLLVQMSQCNASGMPSNISGQHFEKIIKDFTYNWVFLDNLDSIGRPCIDTTDLFIYENQNLVPDQEQRNHAASRSILSGCNSGAAAAFPELAEICSIVSTPTDKFKDVFLKGNAVGGFIFGKLVSAMTPKSPGGGLGGGFGFNSASAKCKDFCESSSVDPNEKYGPGNNNNDIHINSLDHFGYSISFENLATATANAAYVEIIDTLDNTVFDLSSFQIGKLGWGDTIVQMDANRQNYSFLKDLRPGQPNKIRVDIRLDTDTGVASWRFYTLDTLTLQLTDAPNEGFLPPNISTPQGEGFVTFSIKPKAGVTSGAIFENKASITFDENAPIITQTWTHIADTTKPESYVLPLASNVLTEDFAVTWTGSDQHSGISKYQIYVSKDDSLYQIWKPFTTSTTSSYQGQFGHTYRFISLAKDKAGNYEDISFDQIPDAVTTPLASGMVISVKDGVWNDPTTWSNNQIPDMNTDLIVKHQVNVEANGDCKKCTVIASGVLQINTGFRLDVHGN